MSDVVVVAELSLLAPVNDGRAVVGAGCAAAAGGESGGTVTVISSAARGSVSATVVKARQPRIPLIRTDLVTGSLPLR